MKLSVVIPCYNESKNIPLILDSLKNIIDGQEIEVILVNNGSTDDTNSIIESVKSNYTFLKIINIKINLGYGYGIVSGLKSAKGDFIGYTHADLQTDPADIIRAYKLIKENNFYKNIYIKGDRKGRSFTDQFFTIGMSLFESLYLGKILWDINAQPNFFHRTFFDSVKNNCPNDFSLDLYLLYKAKIAGLNLIRFNVLFPKRIYGKSSWNTGILSKWKFIKRTIIFSRKLKKTL